MTNQSNNEVLVNQELEDIEIIEFCLANEYYGIDVNQVLEIVRIADDIVPIPEAHPSIKGVINLRGNVVPVIHLAEHLKMKTDYDMKKSRIIVSEFKGSQIGCWVSHVTRIYQFKKKEVERPRGLLQTKSDYTKGILKNEDRIIFLLDFERLFIDINPQVGNEDI